MGLVQEFKAFISRGNVLDLAIGVIIGAAFGKIVNSLVNDIIMPPIGMLLGNVDFKDLKVAIGGEAGKEVFVSYGMFIQVVFEFLIVAWVIFMIVKAFNAMQKKKEEAPAAPPAPSPSESLLMEIRDLLKK
jgi:large conductance mechanosensitive channel